MLDRLLQNTPIDTEPKAKIFRTFDDYTSKGPVSKAKMANIVHILVYMSKFAGYVSDQDGMDLFVAKAQKAHVHVYGNTVENQTDSVDSDDDWGDLDEAYGVHSEMPTGDMLKKI